jgi:hypothetical protein
MNSVLKKLLSIFSCGDETDGPTTRKVPGILAIESPCMASLAILI